MIEQKTRTLNISFENDNTDVEKDKKPRIYKKGEWVVRKNDPRLVVCEVVSVLSDETGKIAGYEVFDGKTIHLILSSDDLGFISEGLAVAYIRETAINPGGGMVVKDELMGSGMEIHIGSKDGVIDKINSPRET